MQPNSKFLLNMETKDELLSEGEKYFEKVMQDFNQNRKGRNLRKKTAQRMLPCYYKAPKIQVEECA